MSEIQKFSLAQQIEEVQRELDKRAEVYPGLVRRGTMRQSIADFHVARMTAVLRTLIWLNDNAEAVRKAAGEEKS